MNTVELYARVRRAVLIEGISERAAADRFAINAGTVSKMLEFSAPPGYARNRVSPSLQCRWRPAILRVSDDGDGPLSEPVEEQAYAAPVRGTPKLVFIFPQPPSAA
jgi:hypothetical protein